MSNRVKCKGWSFQEINREFRKINFFHYGLWMIPVNCSNSHWFLLTIDTTCLGENKVELKIYDSLGESQTLKKMLEEKKIIKFIHWKFQQTFQLK